MGYQKRFMMVFESQVGCESEDTQITELSIQLRHPPKVFADLPGQFIKPKLPFAEVVEEDPEQNQASLVKLNESPCFEHNECIFLAIQDVKLVSLKSGPLYDTMIKELKTQAFQTGTLLDYYNRKWGSEISGYFIEYEDKIGQCEKIFFLRSELQPYFFKIPLKKFMF